MLSIETPPCPCKASVLLRIDERTSDQLALEDGDPVGLGEAQTPNFSIRDYVSASRSKDITTNWPFPQQILQLCLKHGVRDVLPPFEPPDSVRARCCRKAVESEQLVGCSGDEKISTRFDSVEVEDVGLVDKEPHNIRPKLRLRSEELVVACSDKAQYPISVKAKQTVDRDDILDDESTDGDAEIVSAVTNLDQIERISDQISELHCSVQVTRSVSEASSEVEVGDPRQVRSDLEVLRDPSLKKCRLIVKSGGITETSPTEDIVSTSSTVSDPMASKVCPVCKVFASTSNTTLNAHIDQCLSTESNTKWFASEILKPKVKPKKKRLMVDIYDTAARCTLEDLDRRNGTNWAAETTSIVPTNEADTDIKRPKLSPVVTRDDRNEGAVYVDSNGIKLRILSKSNDIPPSITREPFKLKKHAKDLKEGDSSLDSKKKCFGSNFSKYMKVKLQTKKLSSFNLINGEIQAAPEGNHHAHTHQEKEELPIEMSNAHEQIKSNSSAALSHWVCSKRSCLPKKLNHIDIRNLGNSVTKNLLAEGNQPDVGNSSAANSHILKFSRPSEDLASFSKAKRVDFPSKTVQVVDNVKKKSPKPPLVNSKWSSGSTSTNDLMPKISRSSGTSLSSPRSKIDEIHMSTIQKSGNCSNTITRPSKSCHPSLKAKKSSIMKNSALVGRPCFLLEGSKGDAIGKPSSSKKFRKQRSVMGTGKQGELPSDGDGGLRRSIKHFGIDNARTSKTMSTHRSDLPESFTRSRTEEIMDQESPSSSIPESEGEDASTIGKVKYKWRHPHTECHDPEMATLDMQVETLTCEPINTDTVISGNLAPTSSAKLNPRPSVEENVLSVCGSEAHVEPMAEKLCSEQEMQYCNAAHDEAVSQSIQVADRVEFREQAESCAAQYTECQAETVSVQESSACLTSHGDAALEIPRENSSITSIRMTSDQNQNLGIDREPSGSPVSTASTISPPSPKYSAAEPLVRPTVLNDSSFSMPCEASIGEAKERIKERRNTEVKVFPVAKEPERFADDQPCCCSRRGEALPRESQFLRQNIMVGTMLPSKGKQISNLNIVQSMLSSFSSYPSSRTDAMATPILESPTGSLTTKASIESAVTTPTCIDFSSPSPSPRTQARSPSNSILRLMGKNLMVANKDEFQLPTVQQSAEIPSSAQCTAPPLSASTGWESYLYHHHQLPGGSAFFGQAPLMVDQRFSQHSTNMRVGGYEGPLMASLKLRPDQQIHQEFNKKPNSPSTSNMERINAPRQRHQMPVSSSLAADMTREVIVIDDSPESDAERQRTHVGTLPAILVSSPMQQRPISCFPPQSQFSSRGYANTMKRGKTSEGSDPLLLPRPFVYQSPPTGHLRPSLYYSQTLR